MSLTRPAAPRRAPSVTGPALRGLRDQRALTLATVLAVAGVLIALLLLGARASAPSPQALAMGPAPISATTSSAATVADSTEPGAADRLIVISADPDADIPSSIVPDLAATADVQWAIAFGPAHQVRNADDDDGPAVPLHPIWTNHPEALAIRSVPLPDLAYLSPRAADELDLAYGAGGLLREDGLLISAAGLLTVPEPLADLEPLIVQPQAEDQPGAVTRIVVLAGSAEARPEVQDAILAVLGVEEDLLEVQTRPGPTEGSSTAEPAETRAPEETQSPDTETPAPADTEGATDAATTEASPPAGDESAAGRPRADTDVHPLLVLALLVLGGYLAGTASNGFARGQRQELARQQVFGARRSWIARLLLLQSGALVLVGTVLGLLLAAVVIPVSGWPWPSLLYTVAVTAATLLIGIGAVWFIARRAAGRDPLTDLRQR